MGAQGNIAILPKAPGSDYLNYYTAATGPQGAPGVRHFGKVTYKSVWPSIDVEFVAKPGTDKPVEYNFILHPGAKISDIKLRHCGADSSALVDGKLHFSLRQGMLSESIPHSYWQGSGEAVKVDYSVLTSTSESITVGFSAPNDLSCRLPLIIDPVPMLDWATYYGEAFKNGARVCA